MPTVTQHGCFVCVFVLHACLAPNPNPNPLIVTVRGFIWLGGGDLLWSHADHNYHASITNVRLQIYVKCVVDFLKNYPAHRGFRCWLQQRSSNPAVI